MHTKPFIRLRVNAAKQIINNRNILKIESHCLRWLSCFPQYMIDFKILLYTFAPNLVPAPDWYREGLKGKSV